jgi:hypothetical protein
MRSILHGLNNQLIYWDKEAKTGTAQTVSGAEGVSRLFYS